MHVVVAGAFYVIILVTFTAVAFGLFLGLRSADII